MADATHPDPADRSPALHVTATEALETELEEIDVRIACYFVAFEVHEPADMVTITISCSIQLPMETQPSISSMSSYLLE